MCWVIKWLLQSSTIVECSEVECDIKGAINHTFERSSGLLYAGFYVCLCRQWTVTCLGSLTTCFSTNNKPFVAVVGAAMHWHDLAMSDMLGNCRLYLWPLPWTTLSHLYGRVVHYIHIVTQTVLWQMYLHYILQPKLNIPPCSVHCILCNKGLISI